MRSLRQAGYIAVTNFNIAKSQEFGDAIDKMIRSARLTLVLWTCKSAMSEWVRKEARLAYELEKAGKPTLYLGVMLEPVSLDLAVDLRGLQMIDLSEGGLTENGLALVTEAVRERIGRPRSLSAEIAEKTSSNAMDEFQLYEYARSLDVASGYEHFLSIYPDGKFAADARRDLWAARAWYMHPFRRGSIGHSLMALSIVVALLGVMWGASQQDGGGEISRRAYDTVLAERDGALQRLTTAEAHAKQSEALAGEAVERSTKLEQKVASLRQLSDSYSKQVSDLQEMKNSMQAELDNANGIKKCEMNGEMGYVILETCYPVSAKKLIIRDNSITSAEVFSRFPDLAVLDLSGSRVSDISPLDKLGKLESLNLAFNPVTDLSPLSRISGLMYIDLWNTKVYDLTPLSRNDRLVWIRLRDGTHRVGSQAVANIVRAYSK